MNALKPCMRLLRQAVSYLQVWHRTSLEGSGSRAMPGDPPDCSLNGASFGTRCFGSFSS